ncbi:MAG: hypothetical protein JXB49_17045 [Bacteroidales bacterium]|nr:hypothetical protein [Bacteroidales bacterium]
MKFLKIFFASTLLIFIGFGNVLAGWREVNERETLIPLRSKGGGTLAFISYHSDGYIFFADVANEILRVQMTDSSILEYNSEHLKGMNMMKDAQDRNKRFEWYQKEPVLYYVTNMKSYKKGVVLFHNDKKIRRVVQFIDKKLNVINAWADEYIMLNDKTVPEAVAVTEAGEIFAVSEKGEILKYDFNGKITYRLIISGLFNESRIVEPVELPDYEKRYYSEQKIDELKRRFQKDSYSLTKNLQERDKMLPDPIYLNGPEIPSNIKALEVTNYGNILVMDDNTIFEINYRSGSIEPLDIRGVSLKENEKFIEMRVNKNFLFIAKRKV